MELRVQFSFRAEHSVRIQGVREETHRHRFRGEVILEGTPNPDIVVDFLYVDRILQEHVVQRFHGKNLNAFFDNPTAEHIARAIFEILEPLLHGPNYRLIGVVLWESPRFSVYYRP